MKKIGIFYSFRSIKTAQQIKKIRNFLGKEKCEEVDVDIANLEDFNKYENFIFAVPTWFDGELPNYWDEFLPTIEEESLKGKKFALFGGGDQKRYSENFVDGLGIMAEFLEERKGKIVGRTSIKGYTFEYSRAQRGNFFVGLALDIENQSFNTNERIENWVKQLEKEFN